MVPGLAVGAFFTVAGLPSVGAVCGLVALAGLLSLTVGVRWHAAKVDELFSHHVRAQRVPVAPRDAAE